MRVWIEQGVLWELDSETQEGFRRAVRYWRSEATDIFVTSGCEGTTHLPHSYHHSGRAFDLHTPEWFDEDHRKCLVSLLGPSWVVIVEPTHLHFQCNWMD